MRDAIGRTALRCGFVVWSLFVMEPVLAGTSTVDAVLEQALDVDCDQELDSEFQLDELVAAPGECIRYRLTVTNLGIEPKFNLHISENTPAFTVYFPAAFCSIPDCIINEPQVGSRGLITGRVSSLASGKSLNFSFTVRVE